MFNNSSVQKRKCAPVSRQIFLVPTGPGDNKGPGRFPQINSCQTALQSHDRDVWRNILQEVKPEVGLMCVQGFGADEPARAASVQMGLAGAAETDEGSGGTGSLFFSIQFGTFAARLNGLQLCSSFQPRRRRTTPSFPAPVREPFTFMMQLSVFETLKWFTNIPGQQVLLQGKRFC